MFTVYILESAASGRKYIGYTRDLESRIDRHNGDREKSTKGRGPYRLLYREEYHTRKEAVMRETYLKSLKGKLGKFIVGV